MKNGRILGRIQRCGICQTTFSVCQPCHRGHWYCSVTCSVKARKASRARTNRAYRATTLGRLSHRLAQQRYRKSTRYQNSEIDHSSVISASSLLLPSACRAKSDTHAASSPSPANKSVSRCHFCRRNTDGTLDGRRFSRSQSIKTNLRRRNSVISRDSC